MQISREWCAFSEFRFHKVVVLIGAYGLAAKNLGYPWKLSARGR